jgi:hypothetical protein
MKHAMVKVIRPEQYKLGDIFASAARQLASSS